MKNQRPRLPVANPVPSFWNAQAKTLDDYRSTEDLPHETDILIIGSGLSGVATAYHILKDNPKPPSIVMLEARQVCSGATGRNGGHVKPDTYSDIPKFERLFGTKAAAQLAAFEAAHVYAVKELVEKEDLQCDFHLTRAIDVYLDPAHAQEMENTLKKYRNNGGIDLTDVAWTKLEDAERISGVKGAQGCMSFTAAHLWPSKLVHDLLQKLVKSGLNLQANTPVLGVKQATTKKGWLVNTARGTIKARKVVYATNAYTSHLLPEYTRAITPVRGIASHIQSPKGKSTPHLVNSYGIRFDKTNNDYLIPRPDGSIIVGGARQNFWHDKSRWFDNISDNELIEEAVPYFKSYMQRNFRGWEDSEMVTKSVWTGILGYSSDFMPHVGEIPGKSGQFIIAGFTGYGMPKILLTSKGLAQMMRNEVSFEATGLPSPFKTTKQRIESTSSPLEESFAALWGAKAKL